MNWKVLTYLSKIYYFPVLSILRTFIHLYSSQEVYGYTQVDLFHEIFINEVRCIQFYVDQES